MHKKQIVSIQFYSAQVLILIIAMTAVFSACQKKPNNIVNQPENNPVLENPNEIATTTGEIDTSDWQTYRNEEYRFELKYPASTDVVLEYGTDKSRTRDFYVDGLYVIALEKEDFGNLDSFIENKVRKDGYVILKDLPNGKIIKIVEDMDFQFSTIFTGAKKDSEMAFVSVDNNYLWITSYIPGWGNGKMTEENYSLVESIKLIN